ncbi:MAG: GNAT family N-acetyltransferase [Proteocatella sp.]
MIQRIEELLMDANPSSCITVDNGFLIRYFNITNVCTINMIVPPRKEEITDIMDRHIKKLSKNSINPYYRIVFSKDFENLEIEMVRSGFEIANAGVVLALNLENREKELFAFANFIEQGIFVDTKLNDGWLSDYQYLTDMHANQISFFENNIQNNMLDNMFFAIVDRDRVIAMGFVTFIDEYMIINDLFVSPKYRNLDYGKKLLKGMLCKGLSRGAKVVLADVPEENLVAHKIFSDQDFEKAYGYYYRGKKLF